MAQISKTPVHQIFRSTSVTEERRLLKGLYYLIGNSCVVRQDKIECMGVTMDKSNGLCNILYDSCLQAVVAATHIGCTVVGSYHQFVRGQGFYRKCCGKSIVQLHCSCT